MNVWILIIFVFTQPASSKMNVHILLNLLIFGLKLPATATSSCSILAKAITKGTATIPCNASESVTAKRPLEINWQKQASPSADVVLVTLDGREDPLHQTKKYVNRTRQDPNELIMYLDQVTVADAGRYECIVKQKLPMRILIHKCEIQLKVYANFSYPEITQEPEGKVKKGTTRTLTCFFYEGYPAPQEVVWIVSSRNDTTRSKGEVVKIQDNVTKLYNVNSSFLLNVTGNVNVSCVIVQTLPLEPVSKTISIELEEESVESRDHTTVIAGCIFAVVVLGIAAIVIAWKRKQCCRDGDRKQNSNTSQNDIPMLDHGASIEQDAETPPE